MLAHAHFVRTRKRKEAFGTDAFVGADAYAEIEKRLGFTYNPYNFALKPYVHIASCIMYDWMHIYLVGGLFPQEHKR